MNVGKEKQRFVPQTFCLQQQGLILALRVNTSVSADPLFIDTPTPILYPPPSFTEVNYQNCV